MKIRIFNKFLVCIGLTLLIIVSVIKIYSVLSFPQISDWNYQQLQKIDSKKNEFSFAVFGDNKNSVKTFENLIEKINQDNIMFAIDVGDLVYDGEKEKFRFFINQIKKSNKPLFTAIGNHDIKECGRANYYELFGKFYYSFIIGNSYFIVLDDSNEKNLDSWQMEWLRNELQKSQNYKYRFVFMHVPLYDPRNGNGNNRIIVHSLKDKVFAGKLNNLFDKNNISMLFVSHIHEYYTGIWGKTPFIVTGGAGAELFGSDPQHDFYHYIKVNVSKQGVKYEIVRLKSPDFELIDRWIHDAWIYVYAFFSIHFLDSILILTLIYFGIYIILIRKHWDLR